jgi:hypothetical protein
MERGAEIAAICKSVITKAKTLPVIAAMQSTVYGHYVSICILTCKIWLVDTNQPQQKFYQ